jgi:cbb3-type cytochrome oxidase subunit 3
MNFLALIDAFFVVPGLIVFIAILLATYWPGRRDAMERNARIPFRDNT